MPLPRRKNSAGSASQPIWSETKRASRRLRRDSTNWKKDIITSPGLYGLECDTVDALKWYSDDDEPGSAGVERKKIFNSRHQVRELPARHQLARVQGSDSHSMQGFESPAPSKPWRLA